MNFKCLFGYHKWVYSLQSMKYYSMPKGIFSLDSHMIFDTHCRLCSKCFKKEFISGNKWKKTSNLNIDEIRSKNLNDILK